MAGPGDTGGQAAATDSTGTTVAAPSGDKGQSANTSQTTSNGSEKTTATGTDSGLEASFFDPKSIEHSPELKAAYKQMQGKFTKSMQKIKDHQKKIEAYDSFISNPMTSIQEIAKQYGYSLVQGNTEGAESNDEAPKTWAEVYAQAEERVLEKLKPMLGEVQNMKQQNVEMYLDNNYSDWRTYEDDMLGLLRDHPSLAKDPDKLYRLAVPTEVIEQRALRAAREKLEGKNANSEISGSSTTRQTTTDDGPPRGGSFNDFVAFAKAKLAKEGIKPPSA